jgi:glucokinase
MKYIGIEIGGTKLQLGVGDGNGVLAGLWRGTVDVAAGPEGIRLQIVAAVPELLERSGIERGQLKGVGIGFGGPVDDATHTVIKSHQIQGWDDFPLADWVSDMLELPAVLGNDADVAGLAEALFGAGKGLSPIFYITIGSGIGGGLIINGEIYRGVGRGAAEIGHLWMDYHAHSHPLRLHLENLASGWGMQRFARSGLPYYPNSLLSPGVENGHEISASDIAQAAERRDELASQILDRAIDALAAAVSHVITLLCPRRIVIGGGVSLMGESLLFEPLRQMVAERAFEPFAGLTDIVPATLDEEVVVHGAVALARRQFEK